MCIRVRVYSLTAIDRQHPPPHPFPLSTLPPYPPCCVHDSEPDCKREMKDDHSGNTRVLCYQRCYCCCCQFLHQRPSAVCTTGAAGVGWVCRVGWLGPDQGGCCLMYNAAGVWWVCRVGRFGPDLGGCCLKPVLNWANVASRT